MSAVEFGNGQSAAVVNLQQCLCALGLNNPGDFAQTGQVFLADGFGLPVKRLATVVHQRGSRNKQAEIMKTVGQKAAFVVGDMSVVI